MKLFYLFIFTSLFISLGFSKPKKNEDHLMEINNWSKYVKGKSPVLTPEETLKTFKLPKGFEIQLVASEPLIKAPVFTEFDEKGRLWVGEMQGYMQDVEATNEHAKESRVIVLEDTDNDGRMDKATTFLEGIHNVRSITHVHGGVIVAVSGELLFCEDKDGDLKADSVVSVGPYAESAMQNLEHSENGMLFSLDNWMYNSKSNRRFQWQNKKLVEELTLNRGQWGIDTDSYGRLLYNHNSTWIIGDWAFYDNQWEAEGKKQYAVKDQAFYATKPNTDYNRNYKPGKMDKFGRQKTVSSISGIAVNGANNFGAEWKGALFISESAGATIGAFLPKKGLPQNRDYEQVVRSDEQWEKLSFLTSTDDRFRPVNTKFGPDGNLYITAIGRANVQHKRYLTKYLKNQLIDRDLHRHINRGRIYRVVKKGGKVTKTPKSLIEGLQSDNLWWRLRSQKLIVQGQQTQYIPQLKALLTKESSSAFTKVHALWTLKGLNALDSASIKPLMFNHHWFVQMTAIRLAGSAYGDEATFPEALKPELTKLSKTASPEITGYVNSILKDGYINREVVNKKSTMPQAIEKDAVAKKLWLKGKKQYKAICSGCHQPDGKGLAFLAPQLAKSDWVTGKSVKLIAAVTDGVSGPIKINGKLVTGVPPIMPPHKHLSNEDIASILTYIRNAWGNKASAIKTEEVEAYRKANPSRSLPWTEEEINKL